MTRRRWEDIKMDIREVGWGGGGGGHGLDDLLMDRDR
jgi:hypothetical protein